MSSEHNTATPVVEITNLHRRFGPVHAVRGVNLTIRQGEVVGFIGANGAGKTTTMRILTTLDRPSAGTVRLFGIDAFREPEAVRSRIGWMPDDMTAYPGMTVLEYLDFFARAYRLVGEERRRRLADTMDFTDLTPLADRPCKGLSKGQTQRLCLARTLLNDPDLLVLDEPAAGLDPKARLEFKNLVRILKERGKTILISSHILSELGEMCTRLVFIDGGVVVHEGDAESLHTAADHRGERRVTLRIRVLGEVERLMAALDVEPELRVDERLANGAVVSLPLDRSDESARAELLARLVAAGVRPFEFHRPERALEDAFVSLLKNGTPPPLPKR